MWGNYCTRKSNVPMVDNLAFGNLQAHNYAGWMLGNRSDLSNIFDKFSSRFIDWMDMFSTVQRSLYQMWQQNTTHGAKCFDKYEQVFQLMTFRSQGII